MIYDGYMKLEVVFRSGIKIEVISAGGKRIDGYDYSGLSVEWKPRCYHYHLTKAALSDLDYDACRTLDEGWVERPIKVNNLNLSAWQIRFNSGEHFYLLADRISNTADNYHFTFEEDLENGQQQTHDVAIIPTDIVAAISFDSEQRHSLGGDPESIDIEDTQQSFRDLNLSPDGEQRPL